VGAIRNLFGERVLVEAYWPGRQCNVGVLALPDPEALPVAEVVFRPRDGSWPILTYAAKWSAGSLEDRASPVRCPARIEPALAERLGRLAVSSFRATGCRDYARVDLRLDARGEPMILEVNPNPDVGPDAGWARALRASGRAYAATLAALTRQAFGRSRGPHPGGSGRSPEAGAGSTR
jgi:D-alanine-D-alanine ligase